MNNVKILLAVIALFALTSAANAQVLDCQLLYSSGDTAFNTQFNPSISGGTGVYLGILDYSLVVIIAVLIILGMVYAIGYAFRIDKLIAFCRTESLEQVLNIVLIVFLVGSIAAVDSGVAFITSIGVAGLQNSNIPNANINGNTNINGATDLYTALCNNLQSDVVGLFIDSATLTLHITIINLLIGFKVSMDPMGQGIIPFTPGFEFDPYRGLWPAYISVNTMVGVIDTVMALEVGIAVLLTVIFFLFPLFLYLGILFRSFPWTRAAGGAFIALFISFYVVFPAILYPFTIFQLPTCGNISLPLGLSNTSVCNPQSIWNSISSGGINLLTNFVSLLGPAFNGGATFVGLVYITVNEITPPILKLSGVAIAFIISMDMMELLGDLLGAPSLQRKGLLQKVI